MSGIPQLPNLKALTQEAHSRDDPQVESLVTQYNELNRKAKERVVWTIMRDFHTHTASQSDSIDVYFPPSVMDRAPHLREIKAWQLSQCEDTNRGTYIMFIINPKYEVPLQQIVDTMSKVLTKKWIGEYLMSYEQRGTEDEGNIGFGPHVNLVVHFAEGYEKKNGKHCQKEIFNTCKHICEHSLHVYQKPAISDPTNYIKYTMGIKSDPQKMKTVQADIVWRREVNLLSTYGTLALPAKTEEPPILVGFE